ncbi:MAG: polysaccharide export protein [Blastocatellia bacterium]|nr:polysaccharide export protein [Blastocatellia bacterium]
MRPVRLFTFSALVIALFAMTIAAQVKEVNTEPPPMYRIQPGDKLSLKFYSNPELNEASMTVRPDGFISPQLISEIKASGLTTAELKKELEKQYIEFLLTPMLTVSVIEFVQPKIFVGGQVTKPGRYELREAKTVVQAIFHAGGFTRDAKRSMVIHARPDGNGDWKIEITNISNILSQKGSDRDRELMDGDFVFVPESKISQFTKAVEAFRGLVPRFF